MPYVGSVYVGFKNPPPKRKRKRPPMKWWARLNRWDKISFLLSAALWQLMSWTVVLTQNAPNSAGGYHNPLFYFIFYLFPFLLVPFGALALVGSILRWSEGLPYYWAEERWLAQQQEKTQQGIGNEPKPIQTVEPLDIDSFLKDRKEK